MPDYVDSCEYGGKMRKAVPGVFIAEKFYVRPGKHPSNVSVFIKTFFFIFKAAWVQVSPKTPVYE